MSTREMQACLARLYVDESFLRLFELEPDAVLQRYRLTDEERESIQKIDKELLRIFSSSLKAKRMKSFQRAFPALFKLHESVIPGNYHRFYELFRIAPEDESTELGVRFGRFMEESLIDHPKLPAYASDLAKYERIRLWVRNAGPTDPLNNGHAPAEPPKASLDSRPAVRSSAQMATFNFKIADIYAQVRRDEPPEDVEPCTTTYLFRGSAQGGFKSFEINDDTRRLVQLCNGQQDVSEIVKEFQGNAEGDFTDAIVGMLNKLIGMQVLGVH